MKTAALSSASIGSPSSTGFGGLVACVVSLYEPPKFYVSIPIYRFYRK